MGRNFLKKALNKAPQIHNQLNMVQLRQAPECCRILQGSAGFCKVLQGAADVRT